MTNSLIRQLPLKVPHKNYSNNNNGNQKYTSYNENEVTILSQTSTRTTTTTTTHVRRQSLMLSQTESRLFQTSAVNDKLDELYGFTGFPETNQPQQQQQSAPAVIKHRRQTLACPHGSSQRQNHTMQIKFDNVPESVRKINITVEFVDMGPLWLTRLYQGYENDLWLKKPRHKERIALGKKCRWHFYCLLCFKKYCQFDSLKSHLNLHLELYPYGCKLCTVQYTNRNAITRHLRTLHNVCRQEWNKFIGN